jgi:hypothetical protein
MDVKIIRVIDGEFIEAEIEDGTKYELPTPENGWKFDFENFSKGANNFVYVLCKKESPSIIEGCLIFKLINNNQPIMAYIEIAPHNKGLGRIYDLVGACLIAFACKLSFQHGKFNFKGWLAFTVQEDNIEDQNKLMTLYKEKYFAKKVTNTSMVIHPVDGEKLIEQYLNI